MRLLPAVSLLAVTAAAASAQAPAARSAATAIPAARTFVHHATIQMGFHEPSGYSWVELRPMVVAEHPEVRLSAMYNFKGRTPAEPPAAVGIALQTVDAPDAFGNAKRIVFTLADGATITTDSLITVVDASNGHRVETRSRKVLRRDFLRIANSTQVAVRAGALQLTLGEEQLEALRDFASRMSADAYAAAVAAAPATVRTPVAEVKRDWYEAKEVEHFARPTTVQTIPGYPPGMPAQPWRFAIRYVVDTTGHVDPATLAPVDPGDSVYVAALRAVVGSWEFKPADREGHPVRQIVRQVLTYEPTP